MSGWSEAELGRAAELWNDGYTAEDISMVLSREFDRTFSRNAIVGIAHRHRDLFRRKGRMQIVPKTREDLRERIAGNAARWSAAEKEFAAGLWREGQSADVIAKKVSAAFANERKTASIYDLSRREPNLLPPRPVSKGLHPGNIVAKREARAGDPSYQPPTPERVDRAEAQAYDAASLHLPLADLEWKDCRWPVNDAARGEAHLFCGMPAGEPYGYCPHHALRAVGMGTRGENDAERVLSRMGRAA